MRRQRFGESSSGDHDRDNDDVLASFIDALQAGDPVDLRAWGAAHPGREEELRALFENWGRVGPAERRASAAGMATSSEPSLLSASVQDLVRRLRSRGQAHQRYELGEEIDHGGMGQVLNAYDPDLRRSLAYKVIRQAAGSSGRVDTRLLGRFLEEAQVTGQLDHPGVVPVHELGVDAAGRVFFTMKRVQGETLKKVMERLHRGEEGWSLVRVLSIVQRVCETVAFAHSRGVIHRDLKPANIMVGRFGEVFVMDWGLASARGKAPHGEESEAAPEGSEGSVSSDMRIGADDSPSPLATEYGERIGTPCYMSPEQARGEPAEPKSDVYAVGAILYHVLGQRAPYEEIGDRRQTLIAVQTAPATPIVPGRGVPLELVLVCEKAMAFDPADRYEDMLALAADLRAWSEGRAPQVGDPGPWTHMIKWVARHRAISTTVMVALLSVMVVLLVSIELIRAERNVAVAATKSLERKAAEEAFALAQKSSGEGQWDEALGGFALATQRGYPDPIEILLARVDALEGNGALNEAMAIDLPLRTLPDADTAPHRGKILLLYGDRSRGSIYKNAGDRYLEYAEQAIACGTLSPADDAYARAVIGDDVREGVQHLRRAIGFESRHRRANEMLGPLLFFSGDVAAAESAAREFRRLYPEDPSAQLAALAFESIRTGRVVGDGLERFPEVLENARGQVGLLVSLLGTVEHHGESAAKMAIDRFRGRPANMDTAAEVAQDMIAIVGMSRLVPVSDGITEAAFRLPTRISTAMTVNVATSIALLSGVTPSASGVETLRAQTGKLGDGISHYILGLAEVRTNDFPRATRSFYRAATIGSIAPVGRVAAVMALAGQRSSGELEGAEVRRLIVDMRARDLSAEEYWFLTRAARESGFGALHDELAVEWIGRYPNDPYARFLRLEDRIGETRPTALAELEAILKAAPDHEEARSLRDALLRGK